MEKKKILIIVAIAIIILIATISFMQYSHDKVYEDAVDSTPAEAKTKLSVEPRDHVNIEADQTEFTIKGTTEVGATVVISSELLNIKDVKIPVDENGKFEYDVKLPVNEKTISIKFVASSENKTYSSITQYLTRKSERSDSSSIVQETERIAYENYSIFLMTYSNIHTPQEIRDAWKKYDINNNDKLEASEYDAMLRDNAI